MSDTRRYVTPGWNSKNPKWSFEEMTEKYQSKDNANDANHSTFSRNWRFSKGLKNTKYNLLTKIDALKLKEHLDI